MIILIGGEFKNHDVKTDSLSGRKTRPSLAIVRKSVFSLLSDVSGKMCLDLFAGSGALGFEALSRGAGFVYFIDRDKNAATLLRKNLERMNCSSKAEVHNTDFRMALKALSKRNLKFDFVFLDPPYKFTKAYDPVSYVLSSGVLNTGGEALLLSSGSERLDMGRVKVLKEKVFTSTRITIFTGDKNESHLSGNI
ncbi:MAG: 16S rRNA (guanine(966)-N(2))-methyltransferase RsmD [bacterium]|nr:16S rRNA (guanine(966)-N(2))-methyltransferase RsmD [bacterium]